MKPLDRQDRRFIKFKVTLKYTCMSINEVKIEMSNRILAFPILNDTFEFDSAYQKCTEMGLPLDDPEKKKFWMTAFSIKERVLQFMIDAELIAKANNNTYLLTNYGIGKRMRGGYFPIEESFTNSRSGLNFMKFKKGLIRLLEKQPTKSGDISEFVNCIIDCKNNVKDNVKKYLVHLRRIGILEIKEDEGNPATDWWWGNFLGHNPQAGGKVEELYVALTKDYLNKPWKDRGLNWLWIDLGKLAAGALIGAMATMLVRPVNHNSTQVVTQTQAVAKSQPAQPKH